MPRRLFFWKTQNEPKEEGTMSTLATAIGSKQWELAALCLLLGLWQKLSQLPADSLEGLLDVLEGEDGKKE